MVFKETNLSCIHFLLNFRKTPFIQNYQKGSQTTDGNYPILRLVDPQERVNLATSTWLEKKDPNSQLPLKCYLSLNCKKLMLSTNSVVKLRFKVIYVIPMFSECLDTFTMRQGSTSFQNSPQEEKCTRFVSYYIHTQ